MGEAAAVAVRAVQRASGLEAARQLYRQLLALPPAGGSLLHALLDLEHAALDTPERLSDAQLQQLFEVGCFCRRHNP
jgi:U3 small nucleolar RNA-associated protein 6